MKQSLRNIFNYVFGASMMLVLFSGCSPSGPIFEKVAVIPEGKGMVYIYQAPYTGPIAISSAVYIYDKPIVVTRVMRDGGYFTYSANPGKLAISASQGQVNSVEVDVKEGKEYYIQCKYSVGKIGGFGGAAQIHFEAVSSTVGEARIVKCKKLSN